MTTFVLVLWMAVPAASTDYVSSIENYAKGIVSVFSGLVQSGSNTWNKLGEAQAPEILLDLASEAATLQERNNDLRTAMQRSMERNEPLNPPIYVHVNKLRGTLDDIRETLDRFANEVDRAANGRGGDLRIFIAGVGAAKGEALKDVIDLWNSGKKKEAIDRLDDATASLKKMRAGIRCLQDSITDKKAACEPEALDSSSGGRQKTPH